jgi:hypothetical protein
MNDYANAPARPFSAARTRFKAVSVALVIAITMLSEARAAAPPGSVRIVVDKKRLVTGKPPALLFLPITVPAIAAAGFAPLADYATRTVYEGPAAAADGLRASLRSAGHTSSVASDLDRVTFHRFQIDPDTGSISPAVDTSHTPRGTDGLYFLVLRSYPLDTWLDDLDNRNVVRVTEVPPASYVIRCARTTAAALQGLPYVRGVYPLPPAVKLVGFPAPALAASP